MENTEILDGEGPNQWAVPIFSALLGLLAGAVSVVVFACFLLWLSNFLPLPNPWPAPYYARVDYAILCLTALLVASLFRVLRRQLLVFAIGFAFAGVCLVLFDAFLTYIGLDGSWYIP